MIIKVEDNFGYDLPFYPRDAILAPVFAMATCLSVCLSVRHEPVLCHDFFTIWYPHDSSFLLPNFITKFERSHPERGRQTKEGWLKSAVFYL